jgi:F0F1-type ATP synthase alpha subunit
VPRFQEELREFLRSEGDILKAIREEKDLTDEIVEKLEAAIEKFKQGFSVKEEPSLAGAAS